MPRSLKVIIGPVDTDFGIARIVELPDGSGRGEVFDVSKQVWVRATNPKLTVGEMMDAPPGSKDFAARLGLEDPDVDNGWGLPPAPRDFAWLDLPRVVCPETVAAIENSLSLRGWQIADRWAAGAPAMVKRLEAEGTLLARLKEQADLEAETISDARISGRFHDVPDSELLAMYEIPALPD
jgi:hypothetical protein